VSDVADPLAFLVMHQGDDARRVPIHDYVVVGRECAGIDPRNRLVVSDDYVSRRHFEIRLDLEHDEAWLVDTSTNGTRINGRRVEPATATALGAGDRITVGDVEFEFRADAFRGRGRPGSRPTERPIAKGPMALVVGDIVSYSTIAEYTEDEALFGALDQLYGTLRIVLERYRGTVNAVDQAAFDAAMQKATDEFFAASGAASAYGLQVCGAASD
jgi:adenylate cyclase